MQTRETGCRRLKFYRSLSGSTSRLIGFKINPQFPGDKLGFVELARVEEEGAKVLGNLLTKKMAGLIEAAPPQGIKLLTGQPREGERLLVGTAPAKLD